MEGVKGGAGWILLFLLVACGDRAPELLQLTGATMGTTYTVKVVGAPEGIETKDLQADVERILAEVNGKMSTYDGASELSRFNRAESTEWVPISEDLAVVVEEALRVSRLSDGAFDVTVGPLVNLWGFGSEMHEDTVPSAEALQAALARVGYGRIELRRSPPALRKARADVYVDLSALAKGYAVDRVAEHLESQGIADYMVEIGGELRAKGQNPRGQAWTIAIEKPAPGERAIQRVVRIDGAAVATSGDYRNFFEQDGQRYSHAIDPHVGWPIRHRLASVTVIADSAIHPDPAMHADAMATALLVLGPEAGFALAENQELAAFFVVIEGDEFVEQSTPAFARYRVH